MSTDENILYSNEVFIHYEKLPNHSKHANCDIVAKSKYEMASGTALNVVNSTHTKKKTILKLKFMIRK